VRSACLAIPILRSWESEALSLRAQAKPKRSNEWPAPERATLFIAAHEMCAMNRVVLRRRLEERSLLQLRRSGASQ
jgi:hypothetical protein